MRVKSFIATLFLFSAICGIIVTNNIYIKRTAEHIVESVSDEAFSEDPKGAAAELEDFWSKNHPIVGLSVGYKELDRMSDLIIDLKVQLELGNHKEAERLRVMIVECADEISRLERFDLENLL